MVVSSVTPLISASLARVPVGSAASLRLDRGEERRLLLAARVRDDARVLLGPRAEVHEQRRVAAVVEDHVRACSPSANSKMRWVKSQYSSSDLALVGEHRRAARGDRGGGVVLGREDVARGPAHLGAERLQRLDEHRGLDRHVQRAGDARALQRLLRRVLFADRHQARHLGLGDRDFLAAPGGEPRSATWKSEEAGMVAVMVSGPPGFAATKKRRIEVDASAVGFAEPGPEGLQRSSAHRFLSSCPSLRIGRAPVSSLPPGERAGVRGLSGQPHVRLRTETFEVLERANELGRTYRTDAGAPRRAAPRPLRHAHEGWLTPGDARLGSTTTAPT